MGCRSWLCADWTGVVEFIVGGWAWLRVGSSSEWSICARAASLAAGLPVSRVEGSAGGVRDRVS